MIHTETPIQRYIAPGRRVHLVGVGGVSMAPLAEVLHGAGLRVTGSDWQRNDKTEHLASLGVKVCPKRTRQPMFALAFDTEL